MSTSPDLPQDKREVVLSRAYTQYLIARALSGTANQMLAVALGWQMYDLTGSAWYLGLVGLAQFLPSLLLTVPAGHMVDSLDRKKLLAASIVLQVITATLMCWGSVGQWIGRDIILILCVVIGASRALQLPAQQALIPSLVAGRNMPRALAMNAMVNKMSTILGPVMGGFLYVAGAGVVYGVCMAMFTIATVCTLRIPSLPHAPDPNPVTVKSLFAGFAFIGANPVVLGAILVDFFATLLGSVGALLPIYAKDVLQTGPWGLGLLRAAPALGGLVVSFLLARHSLKQSVGRSMFISMAVFGLATTLFALSTNLVLSLMLLTIVGAADLFSTVLRQSLVQMATPGELLGRVSAAHSTSISGSNHLGQFRAGAIAEVAGPVAAVFIGGIATMVAAAACVRAFPALARRNTFTH